MVGPERIEMGSGRCTSLCDITELAKKTDNGDERGCTVTMFLDILDMEATQSIWIKTFEFAFDNYYSIARRLFEGDSPGDARIS